MWKKYGEVSRVEIVCTAGSLLQSEDRSNEAVLVLHARAFTLMLHFLGEVS